MSSLVQMISANVSRSLRYRVISISFPCFSRMGPAGAGPSGTAAAGPDHPCHTEDELQSPGGRCGKASRDEQIGIALQHRYDEIDDE